MRLQIKMSKLFLLGTLLVSTPAVLFGQDGGDRGPGGGRGPGGQGGRGGFPMMGMGMGMGMGGGGMIGLLLMKEVLDELKVDEDQQKELDEVRKSMTESMRGGGDGQRQGPPDPARFEEMRKKFAELGAKTEEKVSEILDPKQMDRLVGLMLQRDGTRALTNVTIESRLKITPDQKSKFAAMETEAGEQMRKMFASGERPDRDAIEKMRKEREEKTMGILTDEQKKLMEELKGPAFSFPQPQWGGRNRDRA